MREEYVMTEKQTLRQEIKKIHGLDELNHGKKCTCSWCIQQRKLVDHICEAIGKTVEGMPSVESGVGNWAKGYYSGSIE